MLARPTRPPRVPNQLSLVYRPGLEPSNMRVPFMDISRQHAPLAEDLRAAFDRVLCSSAFILGEEVERFERAFAEYCGVEHCVGIASGTSALTIMLQAAG